MIELSLETSRRSTLVLDSWPVLEMLRNRAPAAELFSRLLVDAVHSRVSIKMSRINYGEVYYKAVHYTSQSQAEFHCRELLHRVDVISADDTLVDEAAVLKSRFPISYADCFAAALAIRLNAPVVTGDPDFLRLESADLLNLIWLGA